MYEHYDDPSDGDWVKTKPHAGKGDMVRPGWFGNQNIKWKKNESHEGCLTCGGTGLVRGVKCAHFKKKY